MIDVDNFKTKTTLLKKLLKFFLPTLIVPILLLILFYQYFINSLITQEVINDTRNAITQISSDIDIQQYIKNNKYIGLSGLSVFNLNGEAITNNKLYNKNIKDIKKYIKVALSTQNRNLYHNKIDKFMAKPIIKNGKITSFVVIGYKKNLDKRLSNIHQTFLFVILIVVLLIVISTVFTVLFALQVSNPIKKFIAGIETISKGDKTYRIHLQADDEIAVLANSFNMMLDQIEKNQEEIESFNKTLQEKVKEEVEKNIQKDKMLQQQSKLAQMGEMIRMIAHQWRQPLSAISSTSSTILLKSKLNKLDKESTIELASRINEYSKHLSETINDFRNFFKTDKKVAITNFDIIIDNVLSIVNSSLETKKIKIIKELECKKSFETYPNELKQVVLNLIKNAEDALLDNRIKDPYIKIKTYEKEDKYILEVLDNAGGIPQDIISKIFDPYFSTKTKKDGTGLGLYMSKIIIEEHCRGKLEVENHKEGALFRVVIYHGL